MANGVYYVNGTVAGGSDEIDILGMAGFKARQILIYHDSGAAGNLQVTVPGGVNNAVLLPGEFKRIVGLFSRITLVDATNAVAYRVEAYEETDIAAVTSAQLNAAGIAADSIAEVHLQDVVLFPASAAGRTRLADAYFTTVEMGAGAGGKWAAGAFNAAAVAHLFAADSISLANFLVAVQDGSLAASVAGRAIMADDYFTNAEMVAGAGGKFATGCFDAVAVANLFAADSINLANFLVAVQDGALAASVAGRAIMADAFFTTVEMGAGVGGKWAPGAMDAAAVTHLFAADSISLANFLVAVQDGALAASVAGRAIMADDLFDATSVSTVGAGGKFAADAITAGGVSHLFAAGAIDNAAIGTKAIFAADAFGADAPSRGAFVTGFLDTATLIDLIGVSAIDATVVLSAFAANSLDLANLSSVVANAAMDTAFLAAKLADDAFTSAEVSVPGAGGKFAASCITAGGADHLFVDGAIGEDLLTADELDSRSVRPGDTQTGSVADMSALVTDRPYIPVELYLEVANAVAGTITLGNLPYSMKITDVLIKKNGVASAGDTVVVQTDVNGATGLVNLFTAVDIGAATWAVTHANAGWDAVQSELVTGADIAITTAGAAGDRGFTMIIRGRRN